MLPIVGSPFQFTVGPITDVGAHKVRAIGPGLEKGEVFVPSKSISIYSVIIAESDLINMWLGTKS